MRFQLGRVGSPLPDLAIPEELPFPTGPVGCLQAPAGFCVSRRGKAELLTVPDRNKCCDFPFKTRMDRWQNRDAEALQGLESWVQVLGQSSTSPRAVPLRDNSGASRGRYLNERPDQPKQRLLFWTLSAPQKLSDVNM
jgi:hypothetical protein